MLHFNIFLFSSSGGKVIKDRKTINRIPQTYSLTTISILWGLAGAGLVLCIGVLVVNVKYRNIRYVVCYKEPETQLAHTLYHLQPMRADDLKLISIELHFALAREILTSNLIKYKYRIK